MKILILILFYYSFLNAIKIDINKNYITELLNYKVILPKNIDNPFIIKKIKVYKKIKKKNKTIKKKIYIPKFEEKKLFLLAIFNNQILVKIQGFKKWIKEGDKIEGYKILKIIDNNSILVNIRNKNKIITLKKNKIDIKVK